MLVQPLLFASFDLEDLPWPALKIRTASLFNRSCFVLGFCVGNFDFHPTLILECPLKDVKLLKKMGIRGEEI